jgi:hypothetical protein
MAITTPYVPMYVPGVFAFEPGMVESSAIEIGSMVPLEIRTVVFIVETVAEVAIP